MSHRIDMSLAAALAAVLIVVLGTAVAGAAAPPDLWKVGHGSTGSGKTELHIMDGGTNFVSWMLNWPSADGHNQTDSGVEYVSGDFNTDGHPDVWKVGHGSTGSGKTEVHILDGSNRFGGFLLNWPTADGHNQNDSTTEYVTGDFNTDGRTDLWKIAHGSTGSNTTEVHIMNGANNFQSYLLNWPTADGANQTDSNFEYVTGDYNRDGRTDLWKVQHTTSGSNKTEVHILDGSNNFQSFLGHPVTVDGAGQSDGSVEYAAADYNGDGHVDLWKVKHGSNGSGKTELSIMDGSTNFSTWLLNATTIDGHNQADSTVEYLVADYSGAGNSGPPPTSCTQSGLVDSFETDPVPNTSCFNDKLIDGSGSVSRTTAVANHGSSSMLSQLDPTGTRAEVACWANSSSARGCTGAHGSEMVYEFDFNVPSGYTLPSRSSNIMQTKPSDLPTTSCYGGGLQVKQDPNDSGRVQISLLTRWGSCSNLGGYTDVFVGTYPKNTWHRLKLHAKWNNSTDVNQGFIAAWLNGQPVVPKRNQRNLIDGAGREQYFRLGLYETLNNTTWRVYYDNVVIRKMN